MVGLMDVTERLYDTMVTRMQPFYDAGQQYLHQHLSGPVNQYMGTMLQDGGPINGIMDGINSLDVRFDSLFNNNLAGEALATYGGICWPIGILIAGALIYSTLKD